MEKQKGDHRVNIMQQPIFHISNMHKYKRYFFIPNSQMEYEKSINDVIYSAKGRYIDISEDFCKGLIGSFDLILLINEETKVLIDSFEEIHFTLEQTIKLREILISNQN